MIALTKRPHSIGPPLLPSLHDGWRERRFLLQSPGRLFILPGVLSCALGGLISLTVLLHLSALGREWDLHSLIAGALLLIVGVQIASLGACAQAYAAYFLGSGDAWFAHARERYQLEHGLLLGGALALLGVITIAMIAVNWIAHDFGALAQERAAILASTLFVCGLQIVFSSFLISIFRLRRRDA